MKKALTALVLLFCAPMVANAVTILGPLDAVTGIDDLTFTDSNGQHYDVNVTFVSGDVPFSIAYPDNSPFFNGNSQGADAAVNAIVQVFRNGSEFNPLVTGITGGESGYFVPYNVSAGIGVIGGAFFDTQGDQIWSNFGGAGPTSTEAWAVITPVPLPGAAWLLICGIGGLGAFERRRRAN